MKLLSINDAQYQRILADLSLFYDADNCIFFDV